MGRVLNAVFFCMCVVAIISCSENEVPELQDNRSFVTNNEVEFFINRNGTVNLTVTGNYVDDGNSGEVSQRGFVYSTATKPVVADDNTETALGAIPVYASFYELPFGERFFIRAYFEMSDGTFFYGDEIQTTTKVDATKTRSISMTMESEAHLIHYTWLTPILAITAITQESPVEIGFEYSVNDDFSNSKVALEKDFKGSFHVNTYSEAIENLSQGTKYYIRPYAIYADGTVTNGGNSTVSFVTDSE